MMLYKFLFFRHFLLEKCYTKTPAPFLVRINPFEKITRFNTMLSTFLLVSISNVKKL